MILNSTFSSQSNRNGFLTIQKPIRSRIGSGNKKPTYITQHQILIILPKTALLGQALIEKPGNLPGILFFAGVVFELWQTPVMETLAA